MIIQSIKESILIDRIIQVIMNRCVDDQFTLGIQIFSLYC